MKRYLAALPLLLCVLLACHSDTQPQPRQSVGGTLSGFPTASTPSVSNGETVGPNIATALNVFAGQVIADLTTLSGTVASGNRVRGVITALPSTYTGKCTGTLTATTAGAIAAQQGVTPVAGDVFWLAAGGTDVADGGAADAGAHLEECDAGPMTVTQPGTSTGDGGTARYILTRPSWWSHGSVIPVGSYAIVGGEDSLFGGSTWFTFAAKGAVVDTNDPQAYPDGVTQQIQMSSGSKAVINVPLRSATLSQVSCVYASGTAAATTTSYQQGAITPGPLGVATVTIKAVATPNTAALSGDSAFVNCLFSN